MLSYQYTDEVSEGVIATNQDQKCHDRGQAIVRARDQDNEAAEKGKIEKGECC